MPQHHHQTFDSDGNLIEEVIEEYELIDPGPTAEEEAIEALNSATTVLNLKNVLRSYLERKRDEQE